MDSAHTDQSGEGREGGTIRYGIMIIAFSIIPASRSKAWYGSCNAFVIEETDNRGLDIMMGE